MKDNVIPIRNYALLSEPWHQCAIEVHECRFGDTYRPVCLEDNCHYRGPFVSGARAHAIAEEHRLKSLGE